MHGVLHSLKSYKSVTENIISAMRGETVVRLGKSSILLKLQFNAQQYSIYEPHETQFLKAVALF